MSNLVILFPDWLKRGDLYSSTTANADFPATNIVTGSRASYYKTSAAIDTALFRVDVSTLPSAERTPNFLYIGGLNLTVAQQGSARVRLRSSASSNMSSPDTNTTTPDITPSQLVGARREDYIAELSGLNARNYWEIALVKDAALSNMIYQCRKVMIGNWWDAGIDAIAPARLSPAGITGRRTERNISLTWRGIKNDQIEKFLTFLAVNASTNHLVLYTRSSHELLNNERVFPCQLTNWTITRDLHNSNSLDANFRELI